MNNTALRAEAQSANNTHMVLRTCKSQQFKRTHSVIEREEIYSRMQKYKKKLHPDYNGRLCLETVNCIFKLSEADMQKA